MVGDHVACLSLTDADVDGCGPPCFPKPLSLRTPFSSMVCASLNFSYISLAFLSSFSSLQPHVSSFLTRDHTCLFNLLLHSLCFRLFFLCLVLNYLFLPVLFLAQNQMSTKKEGEGNPFSEESEGLGEVDLGTDMVEITMSPKQTSAPVRSPPQPRYGAQPTASSVEHEEKQNEETSLMVTDSQNAAKTNTTTITTTTTTSYTSTQGPEGFNVLAKTPRALLRYFEIVSSLIAFAIMASVSNYDNTLNAQSRNLVMVNASAFALCIAWVGIDLQRWVIVTKLPKLARPLVLFEFAFDFLFTILCFFCAVDLAVKCDGNLGVNCDYMTGKYNDSSKHQARAALSFSFFSSFAFAGSAYFSFKRA